MPYGMRLLEERMGFEPTVRYKRTQHFQCCALNHLDHLSETKILYYKLLENAIPKLHFLKIIQQSTEMCSAAKERFCFFTHP